MKTLIISDIHNKHKIADGIINKENPDFIIFLGDFFDDFYDTPADVKATAEWLKDSLSKPNRVHLLGNHDLACAFPKNEYTRCSGWSYDKNKTINSILTKEDWNKLQFFYIKNDYLFTHAGLHQVYFDIYLEFLDKTNQKFSLNTLSEWLQKESEQCLKDLVNNRRHWFFNAGHARGGNSRFGGILWRDDNCEKDLPKQLKTIGGHTPLQEPRWNDNNLNLDTHLHHYALIEGGEITIKENF